MSRAARIVSAEDARQMAQRHLPWMVFDYIDGAAGTGGGADRNRAAIDSIVLEPRILRDVSQRDLSAPLFGKPAQRPFGIAPMGMCNLSSPGADLMLARLAAKYEVPLGVSTMASTPLERLIDEAQGHAWFQLYVSGEGDNAFKLAERAQSAGYETLVFTVDVPQLGRRPRELRRGFKMPFRIGAREFLDFALHPHWSISTLIKGKPELANFQMEGFDFDRRESRAKSDWDTLARLRDIWKGRLVVKGVLNIDDALRLKAAGVDAIQVSSHGARQLESAPCPIHVLPKMREALGPTYPILFDSGLRSGEDAFKALKLGADFVFFGRVFQFAIAAAGEPGLQQMWDVLSEELSVTMAQTGDTNIPRHAWN